MRQLRAQGQGRRFVRQDECYMIRVMHRQFSYDPKLLAADIKLWGKALGFNHIGITDTDLSAIEPGFQAWLDHGFHGSMDYMAKHGQRRTRPEQLIPGTLRIISARIDYLPPQAADSWQVLQDGQRAFISAPAFSLPLT